MEEIANISNLTTFVTFSNTSKKFWILYFILRHVMFIIGLLGNIFVIAAINKFKVFHTPSYSIIVNLSLADLLGLLAVPLELIMFVVGRSSSYSYGCYIIW